MKEWVVSFHARCKLQPADRTWKVGLAKGRFKTLVDNDPTGPRMARLKLIEPILKDPLLMFDGWMRPNTDGCVVYVGKPKSDYLKIEKGKVTQEVPAPPSAPFFLVFVTSDGTIDDWVWREALVSDPSRPKEIEGLQIWPALK